MARGLVYSWRPDIGRKGTELVPYPGERKMIEFEVRPSCTNPEGGAGVGNIF